MDTYLAYFDETGDDGLAKYSCDHFVLTAMYMPADSWQENFNKLREMRKYLKADFQLHISEEFHTKQFLTDKNPYRGRGWSIEDKQNMIILYTRFLASLDMQCINVIIDKTKVQNSTYPVLEKALTYSIQRIENDSNGNWKYVILSDKGRVGVMSKTARKIRAFNPIPSIFCNESRNLPIQNMIEDIWEKDSKESYFIQAADFISYFAHLYFLTHDRGQALPNRVAKVIDSVFISRVFATLKHAGKINMMACSNSHPAGFVIYPK